GGIDGKIVRLLVYDDRNDVNIATEKATEILDSTNALAVLGHLYSSTSIAAGKIYKAGGISAISATATADEVTQDNSWYFRVIFNNRLQASFIANYAEKILKHDRASIIYSDDSYGKTLKHSFVKTFTSLGGEVKNQWAIDINADDFAAKKKQIISDLLASKKEDPGIIFCATHNSDVVDLIVQMRRKDLNYPLIGADSLGNTAFAQKFQQYAEEKTNSGYFSNGIYAVSPIIFDVANEKAQQFRNQYIQQYKQSPSWTAANYYDAAYTAVEAIKKANIDSKNLSIEQQRNKVKNALEKINNIDNSIQGLTGNLYFDRLGDFNESIHIGTFEQQKFISAFTQLQPVKNVQAISNFDTALNSGKVLSVDGKYMHKTNIVYTGIDINEIRNLDEKTSSYLVDFYLWFRYQGDIDADNIEFTNYGTDRMDSGDKLELDDPIQESAIDGVNYRVYRIKADFKEKFRFDNYPFDSQELAVRFRHINLTRKDLIYVVDVVGMRDTIAQEVINNWGKSKVFETISDWKVKKVDFFPSVTINDSTLGNPKFFGLDTNLEYSRFNTVIHIKRDVISFSIKNLLPLLFFVGVSYLLLFLPFENISIEAVSGTLLAIVFFHLSLLDSLPEGIGYVVALDYGFYVIYALIGLELLLVVIGNKPEIRNDKVAIHRLIITGRITFPVILFISAIALLINYGVINN
ncbi:MAG: ABC transporter substrate-binding protein, partial [Pleurocapsa sp.]